MTSRYITEPQLGARTGSPAIRATRRPALARPRPTLLSYSPAGVDGLDLAADTPATNGPTICDLDGDGKNEVIVSSVDATGDAVILAVDADGTSRILARAIDGATETLAVTIHVVAGVEFVPERIAGAMEPALEATARAYRLVRDEGIPFREAYRRVADELTP